MSVQLLVTIGALALLDTISPAMIGVTVYLLFSETRQLGTRLVVYLSVVVAIYFAIGVCLMLGLDVLVTSVSSIFQNRVVSWIMFSMGAVLFIASFYVPTKKTRELPTFRSLNWGAMVALGITTILIEAGTAFPNFAAIGMMVSEGLGPFQWLPVLIGYNFVMILPPILIYLLHILFGRRMHGPLNRLREKVNGMSGSTLSWILCIVGLLLIFNTLDYL